MEQQPPRAGADNKDQGECDGDGGDEGNQKGKKKATRDMRYGAKVEEIEDGEVGYDEEHEDESHE